MSSSMRKFYKNMLKTKNMIFVGVTFQMAKYYNYARLLLFALQHFYTLSFIYPCSLSQPFLCESTKIFFVTF